MVYTNKPPPVTSLSRSGGLGGLSPSQATTFESESTDNPVFSGSASKAGRQRASVRPISAAATAELDGSSHTTRNPLASSVAVPDKPTTAVKPRVKDDIGTDPAFNSWVKGGVVVYVSDIARPSAISGLRSVALSSRQPIHIMRSFPCANFSRVFCVMILDAPPLAKRLLQVLENSDSSGRENLMVDMLDMYMPETYKQYQQWCDAQGGEKDEEDDEEHEDDRNPSAFYVEIRRVKYIEELEWVTAQSHPKRKLVIFVNDYIDRWLEKAETGDCLPGTFPNAAKVWAKPRDVPDQPDGLGELFEDVFGCGICFQTLYFLLLFACMYTVAQPCCG
jgi:hypothetical protein